MSSEHPGLRVLQLMFVVILLYLSFFSFLLAELGKSGYKAEGGGSWPEARLFNAISSCLSFILSLYI